MGEVARRWGLVLERLGGSMGWGLQAMSEDESIFGFWSTVAREIDEGTKRRLVQTELGARDVMGIWTGMAHWVQGSRRP